MKVVVCDKEPDILSLVSTRLKARGYEVVEFTKQEEALLHLEQEPADCILLSTDMDRMGGTYLIEKIRLKPHLAMIPIIMMTGRDNVAELVVAQDRGYDDFLVKPFDPFVLQLRVAMNIRKTRDRLDVNALTHLPGNHAIERIISEKISRGERFSVLYIDINQFKSFNDRYGFDKGDDVIRHTARILVEQARAAARDGHYFIGHVGGDDFLVVLNPEYEEAFAKGFIEAFDRIIVTYYNEEDRKRGYVRMTNRRGKREDIPLMSCSVAACNNLYRNYRNLGEIAQDAAQVKSFLKSQQGSHYLRDRRSEPIMVLEQAAQLLSAAVEKKKGRHDAPLGKMLLESGKITEEQLTQALKKHFETGKRLGQVLIAMEAVTSDELGEVLEKKLRLPYVSVARRPPAPEVLRFFTPEFLKTRRILPLEQAGTRIRLGMSDPADELTKEDVARITGLKPVPCVVLENEMEEFWDHWEHESIGTGKP